MANTPLQIVITRILEIKVIHLFKKYNKFNNTPSQYYWQNDTTLHQILICHRYIFYIIFNNDMVILDENRNLLKF